MKKYILIFNLIIIVLTSCNTSDNKYENQPDYFDDENLISMLDIYNQMLDRMKSADINALEKAFLSDDEEQLGILLNYSSDELIELSEQLQIVVNNLINKYPELNDKLDKPCVKCNTEREELFELLKRSEFKPLALVASPRVKTRAETDGCQNSDALVTCFIGCALAPATVWAYPACCLACYYYFC